ncbi:uncharacterized protein LOC129912331 [Episyrphus balteatus]|uniref:uncharacterized protein LOC129912331 n=1 Tax=Episyrphus balteatus TaxID=286459 RepID=UPI002484E8D2|nr:uncharacterized protein LOC129912331 [Episyrphus balteatus]
MFKLIVLSAVLAVAAARPGLLGLGATSILEPSVQVGSIVRTIPTAISHSSQTQVHSSPIVTPVLQPVIRTIAAPTIIRSAPILTAAPAQTIIRSAPILTAAPAQTIIKSAPILSAAPASILGSSTLLSTGGQILTAGSPLLGSDLGLGLGLGLKLH